jgi:tricorn protease
MALQGQYTVVLAQEEEALFAEAWWAMSRLYYRPDMNGRDWQAIKAEFAGLVPQAQTREDFYDLLGEMMERLDSSHLGASSPAALRASSGLTEDTGWIGVEWDWRALDARGAYTVASVVPGSPADHPSSELKAGDRIVSIDGTFLSKGASAASLLADKADRKVVLTVERDGVEKAVTIKPLRYSARNGLAYQDWVRRNRQETDRLSGGKLGYVHIQSMDASSLDVFLREIETELDGKQGVIVDVRFNGGGFTSHIILNIMRKEPWLIRTTRDNEFRYSENAFRGNALELPAACLINQFSFSNAEIFAEGFRRMKLGPIIGEATAGGVIGTGAYRLWDGGTIRMPGSGAFAIDGENLERNGRKPDIEVLRDPQAESAGKDVQLERAVAELLKRLR